MEHMSFSFADAIAGYVTYFNRSERCFGVRTSHGREYQAYLTPSAYGRITQNLEEPYNDCTARFGEMLSPGQHVFAYGIFYPQGQEYKFEVKSVVFPGDAPGKYRHEESDWWVKQIRSIAQYRCQFTRVQRP
ncbi:hypothetical protein [Iningainema tapete]|uniref:hypothetical protein n=1 Tax=Iningainema tapete TaxID=2806730 RepID=UPI00192D7BB5|nr:hypothetical protein [Iningainema tapete]